MAEFSLKELEYWNERIEKIAKEIGLNYYEQEFEICTYEDMIGYEAYVGMPSHYPHWSYGKSYDRIRTLHKYNLTGLPYEMVINSDPCLAYLMKDNTLLLQILTIAHVYGHNDFFKNNRLFKTATRADLTVEMFKNQANRVRDYIQNPGIGYAKVEKILNAAHSLKFQVARNPNVKRKEDNKIREDILTKMERPKKDFPLIEPEDRIKELPVDFYKTPMEPEEDILWFINRYGRHQEWEKDLINIAHEEAMYFIPQIETKIMNEGWASFWHYNILNKLELDQGLHFEFLKRHNQVIRPHEGRINPYYVGFKIFEDLVKRYPDDPKKIFEVREVERDDSFIRRYLTEELCVEMNLFEYKKRGREYIVTEVADDEGWKEVRNSLANSVGMGGIPNIKVLEWVKKDNHLYLEHSYDGRELELNYAQETLKHISDLWDGKVALVTTLDGTKKVINCDESKRITLSSI